jgi:RimJ/RimL family protein N-acetyltransferase
MLKLRPVSEKDCKLIWKWANDPDVRAVSFSSEPISYEHHVKWFNLKLKDIRCFFYIAETANQEPIGQVRYELDGNEATINISIDQHFRGKGYGPSLIQLASKKLFNASAADVIHAYVKAGNELSLRAFKKAGFRDAGTATVNAHKATHLILKR